MELMGLDIESLRCFEATATWLNFRSAAQRVALSPAALSDRIRKLEEQLGEALLTRTTRKVELTAAGERLLPYARQLLDAHARAFEVVKGNHQETPFELFTGTRYELGMSWLVPMLPSLEALHPARRLNLFFASGEQLILQVRQGVIDCAITSSRLGEGAIDYSVIYPERYVMVGSKELLAKKPLTGVEEAKDHVLIDLAPDLPLFRYFLDQAGGSALWKFKHIEYLGTIGAVRLRLLQGKGIAILPEYFVIEDLAASKLKRIMPEIIIPQDYFRLIWRHDHPKAEAIKLLAEDLKRWPLR